MTYKELLQLLQDVPCIEARENSDESVEFVMHKDDSIKLDKILHSFFGEALKPAGQEPTESILKGVEAYGGIRDNQTLYYIPVKQKGHYAMLWPWGDGENITVMVFQTSAVMA